MDYGGNRMNGELMYQQSIAAEFVAIKDRVRYFIKDSHWGEDGRYKEVILINYLRRILPNGVSVGTGFVKNNRGELTNQIDIIIYKEQYPKLFSEGDFVILMPESVIGIIEVKSTSTTGLLTYKRNGLSVIEKAERNGKIIGNKRIFNGIFTYDNKINFNSEFAYSTVAEKISKLEGYLNCLSLGSNNFIKYWEEGSPSSYDKRKCYSAYNLSYKKIMGEDVNNMQGFSFGYFISNLMETVYKIITPDILNKQYFEFLYPLEGGKESYKLQNGDIYI
ncbi:DUF6602 domain-containing protein [Anaerocolumna aminovalerica]|uniref:DUF6602 domain-containing protein n=1 Tax=Anaerocolumna aminovalerica TaxID=1527 RepID=UPI001A9A2CFC|nr:DUF6602 domain-containing protein [Anaerocolumna aminovalerica]